MPTLTSDFTALSLGRLEWDSNHFGFAVGRIAGDVSDDDLQAALVQARTRQYRLIYWATAATREAPPRLLADFGGRLVDRKVTYARPLPSKEVEPPAGEVAVCSFAHSEASPELIALGIAAGEYSRFAVDPCIPRHKFEALYQSWVERSVRREIAGDVLVAWDDPACTSLAGMITVKITDGVGNIGLIAVAQKHRGRGIGSLLIHAAHRWMLVGGAVKTTVVTQATNVPACRLYERTGYTLEHAENCYHFWP